jgi:hypothetical protein
MAGKRVGMSIVVIGIVSQSTYNRKQDKGGLGPKLRVSSPHVFYAKRFMEDMFEFGTLSINGNL